MPLEDDESLRQQLILGLRQHPELFKPIRENIAYDEVLQKTSEKAADEKYATETAANETKFKADLATYQKRKPHAISSMFEKTNQGYLIKPPGSSTTVFWPSASSTQYHVNKDIPAHQIPNQAVHLLSGPGALEHDDIVKQLKDNTPANQAKLQESSNHALGTFVDFLFDNHIKQVLALGSDREDYAEDPFNFKFFDYISKTHTFQQNGTQYTITPADQTVQNTDDKIRKKAITVTKGDQQQTITSYQIPDMKDMGVVEFSDNDYHTLLEIYQNAYAADTKSPLAIHCSGGLGRTGAIALAFQVLHDWDAIFASTPDEDLSTAATDKIAKTLDTFRLVRNYNMVQQPEQVEMAIKLAFAMKQKQRLQATPSQAKRTQPLYKQHDKLLADRESHLPKQHQAEDASQTPKVQTPSTSQSGQAHSSQKPSFWQKIKTAAYQNPKKTIGLLVGATLTGAAAIAVNIIPGVGQVASALLGGVSYALASAAAAGAVAVATGVCVGTAYGIEKAATGKQRARVRANHSDSKLVKPDIHRSSSDIIEKCGGPGSYTGSNDPTHSNGAEVQEDDKKIAAPLNQENQAGADDAQGSETGGDASGEDAESSPVGPT
jgi:protein tyrosine phosphatase